MASIFGKLFRELRKNAGKSMGEVARHLDVSVTYVSDVERGHRAPLTEERIFDAAAFLGIDPTELLDAAAEHHGAYALAIDKETSPQARSVGASLMRNWTDLSEEELSDIAAILDKKGQR